tara:strand:- start:14020 stop:15258 length:1239 start_codon:yes stop_codon:yes gene_type:complete
MNKVVVLILTVYLVCIIYVSYGFYGDQKKLYSIDKSFDYDDANKYKNVALYILKYKKQKDDELYNTIRRRYERELNNPKSILRRKYKNKKYYDFSSETTENLLNKICCKIPTIKNYNKDKLFQEFYEKDVQFQLKIAKDGLIISVSHIFYDGITCLRIINIASDNPDYMWNVKQMYYIPVYNEIKFAYNLTRYYLHANNTLNLTYDYDMSKTDKYHYVGVNTPLLYIKSLKKHYTNILKLKLSFAMIITAIHIHSIFLSSDVNALNIGIIVGLSNTNRLNNFSTVLANIKRPEHKVNNFENIIIQLHNQVTKNKYQIDMIYSFTNIYNINLDGKNTLDIIFSIGMLCEKKPFSINNIELYCKETCFAYSNKPANIQILSDKKNTISSIYLRTESINRNKLIEEYKQYNTNGI